MANAGKVYRFDVGDPLLIAALSYFHPKLFLSTGLPLREPNTNPSFLSNMDDFWDEKNLKELTELAIKLEENYGPLTRQGSSIFTMTTGANITAGTKKKKVSRSKSKRGENGDSDINKKRKKKKKSLEITFDVLSLDQAIIKSIEQSGIDFPINKKKNVKNIQVLLVGGLSTLRGLPIFLQSRLQSHFAEKKKKKEGPNGGAVETNVVITTNEKDADTHVRFRSWKGGQLATFLESIKYEVATIMTLNTFQGKCGFLPKSTTYTVCVLFKNAHHVLFERVLD